MMASVPIPRLSSNRFRRRSIFLPREHGAWGMLLIPLVTGAAAGNPSGGRIVWILLFVVLSVSLFCLRTPIEAGLEISPLRPQNDGEWRLIRYSICVYAALGFLSLAALIFWAHAYGLLWLGAAAALAFVLQTLLKRLGRETRMNAQFSGAFALSATAAGAYYLATGHFGSLAALIWLANWLFAANQIHFVQFRIHSSRALTTRDKLLRGKGFLLHQAGCLLILGLAWRLGWLPGFILIAFGPLFVRGFAWFFESPRPLQIRRLGFSELLYAVAFEMFFIVGSHFPMG